MFHYEPNLKLTGDIEAVQAPNWRTISIAYAPIGRYERIFEGRTSISTTDISYSKEACPCLAGAFILTNDLGISVVHTYYALVSQTMKKLIENGMVLGGMIGGIPDTYFYRDNKDWLDKGNIQYVFSSDESKQKFSVLADPGRKKIFYAYDTHKV